jgi:hypothetical protein
VLLYTGVALAGIWIGAAFASKNNGLALPYPLWLYPIFLLRFVRTQPMWRGILLALLATALVLEVAWLGFFGPFPTVLYVFLVFVGGALVLTRVSGSDLEGGGTGERIRSRDGVWQRSVVRDSDPERGSHCPVFALVLTAFLSIYQAGSSQETAWGRIGAAHRLMCRDKDDWSVLAPVCSHRWPCPGRPR